MKRKSEKQKAIEKEYRKQRKRIQNYVSKRKKKGFFSDFQLPKIPKKITEASVRRLEKITPKKLKKKETIVVNTLTGEVFENNKNNVKKIKKENDSIPDFYDVATDNFYFMLNSFPGKIGLLIKNDLEKNKRKDYVKLVADFIENVGYLQMKDLYKERLVRWYFNEAKEQLGLSQETIDAIMTEIQDIDYDLMER